MKSLLSSFIIYTLICVMCVSMVNTAYADSNIVTPKYVQDLFDRFEEISNKNDLSIHFTKPAWDSVEHISTIKGTYTIKAYGNTVYDPDGEVYFFCKEDGEVFKTIAISINDNDQIEFNIKFVALIITVLDPDIIIVDAKAKAEYLLSTLSDDDYSDTLQIGDYMLTMAYSLPTMCSLYATHQSEIKLQVDKSEYADYSYEEIKLSRHDFKKAAIKGVVEDQTADRNSSSILLKYIDFTSSGNKYVGVLDFLLLPISLENGKEYTFYGTIIPPEGDFPLIRIDYIDEVH